MKHKLEEVVARFESLTDQLMQPGLSPGDLMTLNKERSSLEPLVNVVHTLEHQKSALEDNQSLLTDEDEEIAALAKEEISTLEKEIEKLEAELKILLLPKDPDDVKNVILEIRAGTGGDEAALFAGELFTMYSRYCEKRGWKIDMLNLSDGTKGGVKEAICAISGKDIFGALKFEAGVHRVQRVPQTESQGRVHTSACTVAVLPEAEDVDIHIEEKDLRVDVFRASGPGGQSVNTTDSAVRLTHIPTGLVVQCQDEKSQLKNKNKAMKVLRARVYDQKQAEVNAERAEVRKAMVRSGDRSEKIRTYNFPQDRCTDHRVGLTVHNLPKLFSGDLDELLTTIRAHFQAQLLKEDKN